MKRLWLFISVGCLIVAAVALILWHIDVAFVAAATGAVCWFLDLRTSIREKMRDEELDDFETDDGIEHEEDHE